MKYYLLFAAFLVFNFAEAQNLQFRSNLPYGSVALANIGGYTDSLDNEYALVGTEDGLDIVDVTDPTTPVVKFSVPGATSTWREVKTYRKYAYVTTEGGGGLTVVDLSLLPALVTSQQYTGDGIISGQLNSIHALHCDTAMGYLYLYGSNIGDGQTLFFDLSDPANPVYAGEYVYPGGGNSAYVHDGYVENDTMYEGHIYSGFFTVVDVTDKANPVLLATQTTPTAFTHNTWLSDDHKTLFTTDENNYSFLGAFDISDLQNIKEISRFQTAVGSGSVVHNTHILNDYAVTSWYKEGVVIVDVSRPDNPIEVAKYDTYAQGSGTGQVGCWGVYPFLPSGTIVASDMVNGLYVLTPTYMRGCYLEGFITDSLTTVAIPGATIQIVGTSAIKSSDAIGEYKTGLLDAGSYDVEVSKPGYFTKTITSVSLSNGVLTNLDVELSPIPTFAISGTILDSLSGLPLEGANIQIENADFDFSAITDVAGEFNISGIIPGTYDVICGKWGHVTKCFSQNFTGATPVQFELTEGYYDDFTFDFGWTVSGTSSNTWERDVPLGSYYNGVYVINPEVDATSDCSNKCYVTDNGAGAYNNHDVDNGNTRLSSPIFDASIYVNPTLEYERWFVNTLGSGMVNDSMNIYLSNGVDEVLIESITVNSVGVDAWHSSSFLISPLLTVTSTMQLICNIMDENPGHIVEGGLDHFRITGALNVGLHKAASTNGKVLSAFPNPFTTSTEIQYSNLQSDAENFLEVFDLMGKVQERYTLTNSSGRIKITEQQNAGIYFVRVKSNQSYSETIRIIKQN